MSELATTPEYQLHNRDGARFLLDTLIMDYDPERLLADYHRIVGRAAIRASARADGSTLRSVSLTHRVKAAEPEYDGNNTQFGENNRKLFWERDFTVFNEEFKDTGFYDIYQQMPFRIGRMRLNLLPPLTVFAQHLDSAPRAHVALQTNDACYLIGGPAGEAEAHHVPADGNVYVFDTTLPHTAFNASRQDRMHLTMSLADEEYFIK